MSIFTDLENLGSTTQTGNFNRESYNKHTSKNGEFLRVWDNEKEEYSDIRNEDFIKDYQSDQVNKFVWGGGNAYFLDQEGNIVKSDESEFYNYIKNGYRPLDTDIARAMTDDPKDLESGGLHSSKFDGAVGVGVASFIEATSNEAGFGLGRVLSPKKTRGEEIATEQIKQEHPFASGLGTTIGTALGYVAGGGLVSKAGKAIAGTKAFKSSAKVLKGSKWTNNLLTNNAIANQAAIGAAHTAPYAVTTALGSKDFGDGGQTLAWGVGAGAGLGIVARGGAGALKALSRGTSSLGRNTAGHLEQSYHGFGKSKPLNDFTKKAGKNAVHILKNADDEALEVYNKNIQGILTRKQKAEIFGKQKITPALAKNKTDAIWKSANPNQHLQIIRSLQGKGGSYGESITRLNANNDEISKLITGTLKDVKKVQKKDIAQNQEIKKALKSNKFIENVYNANPSVLAKSLRETKNITTKDIKSNLNKYKDGSPTNLKDFQEFSRKVFYWIGRNDDAIKQINNKGYSATHKKNLVSFLKNNNFTDDEAVQVTKIYNSVVRGDKAGSSVAADMQIVDRLINKTGKLTNAEVDAISKITAKYPKVKNPFNKKVFANTKEKADEVSLDLLQNKDSLVLKKDLIDMINKTFSSFNKTSKVMGGQYLSGEKAKLVEAVVRVFGNKNAVAVTELRELSKGIKDFYKVFSNQTNPVAGKTIMDKILLNLSEMENTKLLNLLYNPQLKKRFSGKTLKNIDRFKTQKKQFSLNTQYTEVLEKSGGADVSAFIIKDLLPYSVIGGGLALGSFTGVPMAILGSTVAAYGVAQAIKKGVGIIGAANIARGFTNRLDDTAHYLNKLNNPKFLLNQMSGTSDIGKSIGVASAITIGDLSESLFGERTDDPMVLQTFIQEARSNPTGLPNSSALSALKEIMNNNGNSPEMDAVVTVTFQKQLDTIAQNIGWIDPKDPEKKEKINEAMTNIEVLFSPSKLMEHAKNKTLTHKMVENFKNTYHIKYEKWRQNIIQEHQKKDLTETLEDDTIQTLEMLFNYDFSGVRGGYNVQNNFTNSPQTGEEYQRKVDIAGQHKTQTQKIQTL